MDAQQRWGWNELLKHDWFKFSSKAKVTIEGSFELDTRQSVDFLKLYWEKNNRGFNSHITKAK